MHSAAEHCPTPTRSGRSRAESGSSVGWRAAAVVRRAAAVKRKTAQFGRSPLYCDQSRRSSVAYRSTAAVYRSTAAALRSTAATLRSTAAALRTTAAAFRSIAAVFRTTPCGRFPLCYGRSLSVSDSVPQRSALTGHHKWPIWALYRKLPEHSRTPTSNGRREAESCRTKVESNRTASDTSATDGGAAEQRRSLIDLLRPLSALLRSGLLRMVAHKCTPLRNTVRHRQGAAAVER